MSRRSRRQAFAARARSERIERAEITAECLADFSALLGRPMSSATLAAFELKVTPATWRVDLHGPEGPILATLRL